MLALLNRDDTFKRFDRLRGPAAAFICILPLMALVGSAQAVQPRYLLSTDQIVSAMQGKQLPTQGVRVRLGAPITAVVPNPALEIQAIAPINAHEIRLRMTCRDRSECLAFFAIATYPDGAESLPFQVKAGALPSATSQPTIKTATSTDPTIRSGASAMMDFEGDRIHIRVEVICLESGSTGDKIRVTTRDRKQFYLAEIVSSSVLKGTLTK